MKVTVLGAGAVGSMLGGLVKHHRPKTEVLLVARGPHYRQMRARGRVILRGPWGVYEVPVTVAEDPRRMSGSDVVLLTVKSHATEEALRAAAPQLGRADVISVQNGINQPVLCRYVPAERLVAAVTATSITLPKPGSATLERSGATVLGPGSAETVGRVGNPSYMAAVRRACDLLKATRLRIRAEPNIRGAQYNKLVSNVLGCAASLSASDYLGEAVLYGPWRRAVGIPLYRECLEVYRASAVQLARTPDSSDVQRFGRVLRLLERKAASGVLQPVLRRWFRRKPVYFSVYYDLLRGKPTEIDFINGEIVRLAEACGTAAPLNRTVVEMVRELGHRAAGTFFSRDEVISRFQKVGRTVS